MDETDDPQPYAASPPTRWPLLITLAAALLGTIFAAVSTSDFMQHLDRQTHSVHCSFIPGAKAEAGESGCKTVMMSPYSSVFRESVWGGIPISLWALAVFSYLAYRAALLVWKRTQTQAETRFFVAATALPVLMTVIFAFISISKIGTTCKVCVGIYFSSAVCFIAAVLAHRNNPSPMDTEPVQARYAIAFAEGVGFVAALSIAYLSFAPAGDPDAALTGCGSLVTAEDPAGVMLQLSSGSHGEPAIEVLDPLCPSCKAFDTRLGASGLHDRLNLKAVLFPLDNTCNWMITEALHPGACAVSEALLCAAGLSGGAKDDDAARDVLRWAFKNQEQLRTMAAKDDGALRQKIENAFPKVKGCLGSALVKNKLTKSLRWAVANGIPVLTPQLFVGNARMCDEDSDLGLEYTLSKMLSPSGRQARASIKPPPKPAAPKPPPAAPAAVEAKPKPAMIAEPPPPSEGDEQ
jgi:uncharacterized membrane protein